MLLDQIHYTSCRVNLSGSAGFHTRATSPGIGPEDLAEIEATCGYDRPEDSPADPTPDQIRTLFPPLFRFGRLSSGRWFLTRSRYVGLDYSGRTGNFFAHTLVGDNSSPDRRPLDFCDWIGWKDKLNPDEDTGTKPPTLVAIDASSVPPAKSTEPAHLREFLKADSKRLVWLAHMLRATLNMHALTSPDERRLIIRDGGAEGLLWSASLLRCLPIAHAGALTFCTYQYGTRNMAAINATIRGTELADLPEGDSGYVICSPGRDHPPKGPVDDYAATIAMWLRNGDQATDGRLLSDVFAEFLSGFTHNNPDPCLDDALGLFRLTLPNATNISTVKIEGICNFATRFAKPNTWSALSTASRSMITSVSPSSPIYRRVIDFTAEVGRHARQEDVRPLFALAWERLTGEAFVMPSGKADLADLRKQTADRVDPSGRWPTKKMVEEKFVAQLAKRAASEAPEALASLFQEVVQSATALGQTPGWQSAAANCVIVQAASVANHPELAGNFLVALGEDPVAIATVSSRIIGSKRNGASVAKIAAFLQTKSPSLRSAVRQWWDRHNERELLIAAALAAAEQSPSKGGGFVETIAELEKTLSDTMVEWLPGIADAGWLVMDNVQKQTVAARWVVANGLRPFSLVVATNYLSAANAAIGMSFPDAAQDILAEAVDATARRLSIRLNPDMPNARNAVGAALHSPISDETIAGLKQALALLPTVPYQDAVRLVLTQSARTSENGTLYARLLAGLIRTDGTEFAAIYLPLARSPLGAGWAESGLGPLAEFLVAPTVGTPLSKLAAEACEEFVRGLCEATTADCDRVLHAVEHHPNYARFAVAWQNTVRHRVEKQRKSYWNRATRLFGSARRLLGG